MNNLIKGYSNGSDHYRNETIQIDSHTVETENKTLEDIYGYAYPDNGWNTYDEYVVLNSGDTPPLDVLLNNYNHNRKNPEYIDYRLMYVFTIHENWDTSDLEVQIPDHWIVYKFYLFHSTLVAGNIKMENDNHTSYKKVGNKIMLTPDANFYRYTQNNTPKPGTFIFQRVSRLMESNPNNHGLIKMKDNVDTHRIDIPA